MKRQKIRRLLLLVSFLLFPVIFYYISPYLILNGGFSGIVTGSFIVFIALFFSSLLFGRAFCGWICPAGAFQDNCTHIVDKKVKGKKINWVKYFIWAPWLLTIVIALIRAGGIRTIDFFYFTDNGISASGVSGWSMYFFVVGLIMIIALIFGRRGMCHSICWIAPFMIIGTKIKNRLGYPSLHLQAKTDKCIACGLCSKNCPMSLDVSKMVQENNMENAECILCGECTATCQKKAIEFTFTSKRKQK